MVKLLQEARMELDQKLMELIIIPYRVTAQDWGFRPTTPDRRPILGSMPDSENVVIFNGLGTKGVSLAPYFSAQLCDWLIGSGQNPARSQYQCDLNRYLRNPVWQYERKVTVSRYLFISVSFFWGC
jgi:glycine/D-amino acid oxidase-like deaminating enzyme